VELESSNYKKEPPPRCKRGRLAMIIGQMEACQLVGLDTVRPTAAIHRLSYIARYRSLTPTCCATQTCIGSNKNHPGPISRGLDRALKRLVVMPRFF
jgi:hypothetical protein